MGNHCTNAQFHDLKYDSSTISGKALNSSNAIWPGRNVWQYSLSRVLDSTSMTFLGPQPSRYRLGFRPQFHPVASETRFQQFEPQWSDSDFFRIHRHSSGRHLDGVRQNRIVEFGRLHGQKRHRVLAGSEILKVNAYDLKGVRVASFPGTGQTLLDIAALKPGLYNLQVETRQGTAQAVYSKL